MLTSRRDFLSLAAGAVGGGLFCGCHKTGKGGETYSIALLGDTHFDSTDTKHYHSEYLSSTTEARYKAHLKEHVRNAKMWQERMPSLLRASAACVRDDTALILQMGDLVQGDCNNPATHRRMLTDAFNVIKGAYGDKLPFVSVVGNHDIRGDIPTDGTREAFDAWQPPVVGKELKQVVSGTTFSFWRGPDVFIVVDFNEPRPDLDLVKRLFAESGRARYTFLVSHGPAIPNGASRWFLLGDRKRNQERRELLRLMASRNTIVLSGHTHLLEYYDCVLPEGRVTQFVANSVWAKPESATLTILGEGVSEYGARVKPVKGKKPVKDKKQAERKAELPQLVEEYRPLLRDYLLANAAGHYRLEVGPSRVAVVFYEGAATSPTRTFTLR